MWKTIIKKRMTLLLDRVLCWCKKPVTASSHVLTIHQDAKFARKIKALTVSVDYQKLGKSFHFQCFFGVWSLTLNYWYIRTRCIGYDGGQKHDCFVLPNLKETEIPDQVKNKLLRWYSGK